MKATELRIGNLILSEDDYIIAINQIQQELNNLEYWVSGKAIFRDYACNYPVETYQPILLTAEWLKKFGAKNTIDLYWISITNLKAEFHFEVYEKEIVTTIKSDFCNMILDPIKYVHELQNLYYALTKEELVLAVNPL